MFFVLSCVLCSCSFLGIMGYLTLIVHGLFTHIVSSPDDIKKINVSGSAFHIFHVLAFS